jgi:hypothetical protein
MLQKKVQNPQRTMIAPVYSGSIRSPSQIRAFQRQTGTRTALLNSIIFFHSPICIFMDFLQSMPICSSTFVPAGRISIVLPLMEAN